jgi:hypothetical protein
MKAFKYILLFFLATLSFYSHAELRGPFYNPTNVAITGGQIAVRTTSQTAAIATAPGGSLLQIQGNNVASARLLIDGYGGTPGVTTRRANTSAGSPSARAAKDIIFGLLGAGYGATGYVSSSSAKVGIQMSAAETWTDTASGTYIDFQITPKLSTTIGTPMRLQSTGALTIGTTTDDTTNKLQVTGGTALTGALTVGGSTLTVPSGGIGMLKITADGVAPGAAGAKLQLVCGTNAGTAKLVISAGTSATTVTVVDNIGAGVTGC